ncbi:MAG TPA: hypothetical protein VG269_28840 [Tepidisphaeraceae bacterium]|jgi:hypothetical protein|nr:hypothetical protein [Tepidisphaeraceae bacterium]
MMAAFIFIHVVSPGLATAMNIGTYDYDLDSMVYLSGGIVEGRLVGPSRLRITAVHAGSLKVGDTVTVDGGDEYQRSRMPYFYGGTPLAACDRIFVFCDRPHPGSAIDAAERVSHITPIYGGIELVTHRRVHPFHQMNNPGPFFLAFGFATVVEHRDAIRASISRVAAWRARLGRPPESKDIPWLISLLKQRYIPPPPRGIFPDDVDLIANAAAERLVALHDLNALDEALVANPRTYALFDGFNTADGREFLLRKTAEESTSRAHRLLLARALGGFWTDGMYASSTRPGRLPDTEDPRAFSYLTRVAKLAASESAHDEELACALLDALKCRLRHNQIDRDSRLQADEDDAVHVLQKLYGQKTTSDRFRFRIEEVLAQIGDGTYQSLNSKCGPMLTLAELDDESKYGVLAVSSLVLRYTFFGIRDCKISSAVLVLEPVRGGIAYTVPSGMIAVGHSDHGSEGGGGDVIPLPTGMAPGCYRLFYRLMDGSKVVSEGPRI